ncbi:hypothetical protein BVI434_2310002 [Burkholderia vietnamiensis]|nr:hypothetical protein BVI434_2310002 [Burkholderia vietnamiensis]
MRDVAVHNPREYANYFLVSEELDFAGLWGAPEQHPSEPLFSLLRMIRRHLKHRCPAHSVKRLYLARAVDSESVHLCSLARTYVLCVH